MAYTWKKPYMEMSPEEREAAFELMFAACDELAVELGIPRADILGHDDVSKEQIESRMEQIEWRRSMRGRLRLVWSKD